MKVRYYGHAFQHPPTGYGKAAEAMCAALLVAGVEVELRPLQPFEKLRVEQSSPLARCIRRDVELSTPDAVMVHTLPLDCKRVVELAPGLAEMDVPIVAYTTWEGTSQMPVALAEALSIFDQVWTPNTVHADLMRVPTCTTRVMPHAFDDAPAALGERRKPRNPSFDDGRFKFYYVGAWNCRKYPEGVIRAFVRAFGKDDPVTLVIRSVGTPEDVFAAAWHRTGLAANSPRVIFGNKPVSEAAMMSLHCDADCFVTATRGEGWNLPAFEAMLAERNVISPRHVGSDEFLLDTSARLYRGYPVPACVDVTVRETTEQAISFDVAGAQGLDVRSDWQEPDLAELADVMSDVYKERARMLDVRYNPADRFGYRAVGALARTYLEAL